MIDLTGRDPFIAEAAGLFAYDHLPPRLQVVSKPFHDQAEQLLTTLPDCRQLLLALDHLVAAKDCAVRAAARCDHVEPEPPRPAVGQMVDYTLGEGDVATIDANLPHHVGNRNAVHVGDVYPAMVVRVFDPSATTANLQVFLDGVGSFWATSRAAGDGPGRWRGRA